MYRIIAGATGLIGTELVNHWLAAGHIITVIGRSKEKIQKKFNNRVHALEWDELQTENFDGTDIVVNLAGAGIADKRWNNKRKEEILLSRIDTTKKIVNLLIPLGRNAPSLFNASAVGIYGLQKQTTQGLPPKLDEATVIDWDNPQGFLSYIGREWEKATFLARSHGIRVVNLRFGVVLTIHGGALPKIILPYRFFLGGSIGTGQQPFSWVTLNDLIRAIDFLVENKQLSGSINIVAPDCVTQHELSNTIARILHKPNFLITPAFILKLLYGEMARELLLEGQCAYPSRLLKSGFQFLYPNMESALKHVLINKA